MSQDETKKSKIDKLDGAKLAELLIRIDNLDRKTLYLNNFLRGIFFGAGSLVGATIVITIILWMLSIFDSVPLIGPIIENTQEEIRRGR